MYQATFREMDKHNDVVAIYRMRHILQAEVASQRLHIPQLDIFIIQERFNKLIYGINTIIKCGI